MDNIHAGKETPVWIFLGLLTFWGGAKRPPVSKICHISYNSETLYSFTLSKEDRKIYKSRYTSPEFFHRKSGTLVYLEIQINIAFVYKNFDYFCFF